MTGRYLLIASSDPSMPVDVRFDRPSVGDLPRLCQTRRFELFGDDECLWQLTDGSECLLIGDVYVRSSGEQDPPYIAQNGASHDEAMFVDRCWGSYVVAFGVRNAVRLIRDPSGTLPCFYTTSKGMLIATSDASLIFEVLRERPTVDWDQLAWLLVANELPQQQTAIAGVRELLTGCNVVYDSQTVIGRPFWNPWDHAKERSSPYPDAVREQIGRVIRTISARYRSILIGVSGGLDSSVVAACTPRSKTHAITISTDDAHGDEAAFAGALCEHLDLPLIREHYRLDLVDIARSTAAHLPRPGGRAQLQAYDGVVLRHAERLACDVFMTGVGGDNVFGYTNSARPLIDRYLAEGWGRHLAATLCDICHLTGASWLQTLRFAMAVPRAPGEVKYHWRADTRFLAGWHRDRLRQQSLSHPWLENSRDGLPGKAAHIAMLIRGAHYIDAQSRALPVAFVQPLLSQPIVEMCLAVPTWEMCAGGRDRSVVRTAFADRLPASVIERRTKGGPDGFAHSILRHHHSAIRERLLGGALAERGLLDVMALEAQLREERMMRGIDYVRILLLLDAEAWARHWLAWPHRRNLPFNETEPPPSSLASDPPQPDEWGRSDAGRATRN